MDQSDSENDYGNPKTPYGNSLIDIINIGTENVKENAQKELLERAVENKKIRDEKIKIANEKLKLEKEKIKMEEDDLKNERKLKKIKFKLELKRLKKEDDALKNNADANEDDYEDEDEDEDDDDDDDDDADEEANADTVNNVPIYKSSLRHLQCQTNFKKKGKDIFKHNKYFKVLYHSKVTQNNKHHLIVDMKTEPTKRKNWAKLREFFRNGTKSYKSLKIRDQNQLNGLKKTHKLTSNS